MNKERVTSQCYIIVLENVLPMKIHCSTTNYTHGSSKTMHDISPEITLSVTRQCTVPHYRDKTSDDATIS